MNLASYTPTPVPTPEPQGNVRPSPVPTTFQVSEATDNATGQKYAMLAISTFTGTSVYFLDSRVARSVSEALLKVAAVTIAPGLVIP